MGAACCVLGAGPAWKPTSDAPPLPGPTSTNAATTRPARASGPAPNSRTLVTVPRPLPQARAQPADPADVANRGRLRPERRRPAGVDGLANGPAAGCPGGPLGYQPTVEPSSSRPGGLAAGGTAAAGAGPAGV